MSLNAGFSMGKENYPLFLSVTFMGASTMLSSYFRNVKKLVKNHYIRPMRIPSIEE